MATGISISPILIIVSVFVASGISASDPCAQLYNDTENTYRCVLNNDLIHQCCSSATDDCDLMQIILNFTSEDSDMLEELMNVTQLVLADLTLESCTKPLIIEHIMMVEITDVTFRGFTDTVLDIFDVSNVLVDNCTFVNNSNDGGGNASFRGNAGAIAIGYSNDSTYADAMDDVYTIVIRNSTFINNTAKTSRPTDEVLIQKIFSGRGGAVALYLPTPNSNVTFTSESNCFMNNRASSAGGAIYAHLSGDFANVMLHVKDCNFTGNVAQDGAGVEFTYDLNKSTCTTCDINDPECLDASTTGCPDQPANSIIEDCRFIDNNGSFGGAFKGIQINPFGNNNLIKFKNCEFTKNYASVGAAAYFQSRYSVADVRMSNSIQMENCTFMSNTGPRSIVFMIRNRVDFIGYNEFINNTGPSIRLVGTLVVFSGMVQFENNRHHSEGLSGALYLSSFGQMLLEENATLNFTGNLGSDGAAIVVKSPRVSSSFSRQLYNPQCFLQYVDATQSPQNWTAKMIFAGNKARVGPVMFVSNLAACEWYSINSSQYFLADNLERWGNILNLSKDHCNCIMSSTNNCSDNSVPCDITAKNLIQTELSSLNVTSTDIRKSPGENVQVYLDVVDERDSSTIAFLKIDIADIADDDDDNNTQTNCSVMFEPSIIPVSPEDSSINFKFRSTKECIGRNIDILISAPFAINPVEPRQFKLEILHCLPGFELKETDNFYQCDCNTRGDVLYCSPDQTTILLKDGTWAASPDVSRSRDLISSPCPARYCNCSGLDELIRSGCALNFNGKSICVTDRKGWLCGECNKECNGSEKSGIGVLTTKCRCSEDAMYSYLVPLVVLYGVVATFIVVLVNYPFPNSLKGILYYIQVSAICTQFIPEDFNIEWEIMDCISNALSFYYPYDFDFKAGLDAISAYGLRYIPIAIVIIIAPIALWIRTRFHPKMVFEGIWTLVLLTYAHLVYTSSSIVNCHQLGDKARWFINGSILCYEHEHLGLSFLAIISLIFAAVLILFTAFIIYHPKIKYVSKLPGRVQLMASNLRSTLINGYRPNYIFWPVVELLRRFIFITAVVLTPGDLTLPLLFTLVVFGVHVFVYPYEDKLSNHIESFVLFVLITVLMLGNTTAVVETTRDTKEKEQFFILLFIPVYIAIVLFVCYLIYKLCYLIQRRFNINIKSWNLAKQSRLLNRNGDTNSTPQVTCTHIDLSDHDYQPLRPNHDMEDDEHQQTRPSHNMEDDEN